MTLKFGYLLPTREQIMQGRPEAAPLLALAERAERLGFDSIWVGDSLLARPRHEPLSLLAGVAGRVGRVELGTAVLLPALRNPVLLAHQIATLDQVSEGRFILGIGIAADVPNIRAEFEAAGVPFEKRVGRMMEGLRLCKALWSGEPVNWEGRWHVENGVLGPTPSRPGGPPIWGGGSVAASLKRAGLHFDGWFPTGPEVAGWKDQWSTVRTVARDAGRADDAVTGAVYLTVFIDDDTAYANSQVNEYLEQYYGQPAEMLRRRQACFAGPEAEVGAWLKGYVDAGASHLMLRFAGDHERHLDVLSRVCAALR